MKAASGTPVRWRPVSLKRSRPCAGRSRCVCPLTNWSRLMTDSTALMGLATRTLQTVGNCTDAPVAAFRDVEQDAARLGCGSLAAAARLACQVAQQAESDADLFRHAMDVVTLVCLNELQDAS